MREINGDIWDYYDKGKWIVITTNGTIKNNGDAVMGRGIALQAKNRFPELPKELGELLEAEGNRLFIYLKKRLFTLPVKHNWWEKADLTLIERGIYELGEIYDDCPGMVSSDICLPRVGCGNGKLNWEDVKPILEKYLKDDRFIVVNKEE